MKCQGKFVFKGLNRRDGGEFTNDKGQLVKYPSCYILKVDEQTDTGIYERRLKVDENNKVLVEKLNNVKIYDLIELQLDVVLYGSNAKVVPIDIIVNSNNK